MNLDCFIDSLGNESCMANVVKGPQLVSNYVDYAYLEKYLMTF